MVITGHTRTYALLGHPVQHSRSPSLHNQWFVTNGIDALYVALDVQPQRAEQVVTAFRTLGLAGANLTVPFKTAVIDQLDGITPLAKAIGAVNTLYWNDGALWGDNTDAQGFIDGLVSTHGPLVGPQTAVILGVGGAGRAVAAGLAAAGVQTVHLLNRTVDVAHAVAKKLAKIYPRTTFTAGPLVAKHFTAVAAQATLVVNCVSGPGIPIIESLPLIHLNAQAIWADLNYWMPQPPAFNALRQRGNRLVDGHPMLLHQAARAFALWTGIRPLVTHQG